jgi:hypothetical protein
MIMNKKDALIGKELLIRDHYNEIVQIAASMDITDQLSDALQEFDAGLNVLAEKMDYLHDSIHSLNMKSKEDITFPDFKRECRERIKHRKRSIDS